MSLRGTPRALPPTLLVVLLGALIGCGPEQSARPPSVLLITLDTLRADHLGLYGYTTHDTSPDLDAFARQSVVFDQAFAASSVTPPSHASILTDLYPSEHGLTCWKRKLGPVPTLAERFSAAGYRSFAVSPLATLFRVGLDRGFDSTVELPWKEGRGKLLLGDAQAVNAAALPRLEADGPRPFFGWLHYYDAHRVYARQGQQWARRYNRDQPVSVTPRPGTSCGPSPAPASPWPRATSLPSRCAS